MNKLHTKEILNTFISTAADKILKQTILLNVLNQISNLLCKLKKRTSTVVHKQETPDRVLYYLDLPSGSIRPLPVQNKRNVKLEACKFYMDLWKLHIEEFKKLNIEISKAIGDAHDGQNV
jgi:hypothetical protein